MKNVIFAVVSFLILFTMLWANEKDDFNIKDDSKCLQFQIDSDFQLSSFQGSTISFKKHISNNRAYRLGFTVSGDIQDINYFRNNDNDTLDYKSTEDNDNFVINITGQYLKYTPYKHSYFYYGLGPHFVFSKQYEEANSKHYYTGEWELLATSKTYSNNFKFGLLFVAGIEIFISKSISIHSEYTQEISYRYYWEKQPGSSTNTIRKYNFYSFDSSGVKFGCSFYL